MTLNLYAQILIRFPPGTVDDKKFFALVRLIRALVKNETGMTMVTTSEFMGDNIYVRPEQPLFGYY